MSLRCFREPARTAVWVPFLLAGLLAFSGRATPVPPAPSPASPPPGPARLDVFVSTGDNHFLGSSLPIDSPASIAATFDLFRDVQRTRRVYWRGLEEACWLRTMHARSENPRYFSLWQWMQHLYSVGNPDQLAVQAARERGMEIWGVGTLWDWGAPADTPVFGDYPFPFESSLRLAHPEWAPADRHGARSQGGPIELAYPEARKALVALITEETFKAGYDGITFLTYVENYSLRFQDEFGFSEPVIQDFKKLHGIDLRKEPFRRGASREDWLRLRGTYVTSFLRELRAALSARHVKLGMIVSPNEPRLPQSWNVPELMITAGSHHMDVDTWVRDGIVDALLIYGNCAPSAQAKAIEDLCWLARGTGVEVSFMTSSPFAEGWRQFQSKGVPTVLAVSDDAQHLERGFVPAQPLTALRSPELPLRLRTLQQVVSGQLAATVEDLRPSAQAPSLIERRLALQALGKLKAPEAVPLLDAGLLDPENGVRCMAALALGEIQGNGSCAALLKAVASQGNHMLRECAVIALRKGKPLPVAPLREAALHAPSAQVREVAMRTLLVHANASLIPVFREGLKDAERFPRFAAAEALGNLPASPDAVDVLLSNLCHADPAVANRCAASLGKIAAANRPEITALQPRILEALLTSFRRHCDAKLPDADWGWRTIGNAVLDCGPEGAAALHALRDQRDDFRLAELAWRVADLPQRPNRFGTVTEPENAAAMKLRPLPPRQLRVDPAAGNDANDGITAPVKTIAHALSLAGPGDTVHLAPAHYREPVVFLHKQGEPGKPIILDGHGCTLDGAVPLDPAAWTQVEPGLYRNDHLLPMNPATLLRWFFVWDSRMNHMGRTCKGPSAALKKPADLQPGEWTYESAAPITRESKNGKPWDAAALPGAFYLRIDPSKTLADCRILAPIQANGVSFSGPCENLVIRNVTATHFHNDGFNIHGNQKGLRFENIRALECGDDGFSAHETAECEVDGFTSIGNSTGLCDVGASRTHYRNVLIRDCLGTDIFFVSHGEHRIENALVEANAARSVNISREATAPADGSCQVTFRNVLVRRAGSDLREVRVDRGGHLTAEHCSFVNLDFQATPGSTVHLENSLLTGTPKRCLLIWKDVAWTGAGNVYDLALLRFAQKPFAATAFASFQELTGSEKGSRWTVPEPGTRVGADPASLPAP